MVGEKFFSLSPRNADVVQVFKLIQAREKVTSHSTPLYRLAFVLV